MGSRGGQLTDVFSDGHSQAFRFTKAPGTRDNRVSGASPVSANAAGVGFEI
jgi:hypothetical protein